MSETLPLSLLPGTLEGALANIDAAIAEHRPSQVFALFSGGNDSLTAAHVASRHPSFCGCLHINTGIGVEETREFVRRTCKAYGWPLFEVSPPSGHTYEDIVRRYGMPGPFAHRFTYKRLKERALREFVRQRKHKVRDRIGLVSGVRAQESRRRMGYDKPVQREGAMLWISAILDWSTHDCERYIEEHRLPRNEVVGNLHKSGECLCGAFARPGEIHELEFFYPAVAARIHELEAIAKARGLPCEWATRPPEGFVPEAPGPLCAGCAASWLLDLDVAQAVADRASRAAAVREAARAEIAGDPQAVIEFVSELSRRGAG